MTTNNGPAVLFRNDQLAGNRSLRFTLVGTKSNRDAIGARVRIFHDGVTQSRMVKSGSSYLSQSELPVTFGVGKRDRVDRVVIDWPSGRTEEFKGVASGRAYQCVEGKGIGLGTVQEPFTAETAEQSVCWFWTASQLASVVRSPLQSQRKVFVSS